MFDMHFLTLNAMGLLQGLENEYDRLLATNDDLQKKLSRLDPKYQTSGDQRGWKKDW